MQPLLDARCDKGRLKVYDDKVELGFNMLGTTRSNTLMYHQITGVEVKTTFAKVPLLSPGAAKITIYGTGNQKLEANWIKQEEAQKAEELINERIKRIANQQSGVSQMDELEKLSNLKDKGVITQEEFDQKKKQLLGLQ